MKDLPFKPGDVVVYRAYPHFATMTVTLCGTGKELYKRYKKGPKDSEELVVWTEEEKGYEGWDWARDVELYELANTPLWKTLS